MSDSFGLSEIADWVKNSEVILPDVQRNFVWKPYQLENFWDSLLRGYPVGAFVLSKNAAPEAGGAQLELLDGQQRATAICLGFGNKTFRGSEERVKLFIDLEPPDDDARKFVFRVITRSHPWGYARNDNSKTLESRHITRALSRLYQVENHLDPDVTLDRFFPLEAVFPLPLADLVRLAQEGAPADQVLEEMANWRHWSLVEQRWRDQECFQPDRGSLLKTREDCRKRLLEIVGELREVICGPDPQRVPALYLDLARITSATAFFPDARSDAPDAKDEIEELFTRLNAGGTPLKGEELNYSILKSRIDRALQERIESCCAGLFKPARFITIAYRLYLSGPPGEPGAVPSLRVKPKLFQKAMEAETASGSDSKGKFRAFIEGMLDRRGFPGKRTLLEYATAILTYDADRNPAGFPYLTVSRLSDDAPEVVFTLLFRLMSGDRFALDSVQHRRMLGVVSLFAWLGKGETGRDHKKLLSNIWPCAVSLKETEQFWSASTVQRAMLDEVLGILPTGEKLRSAFSQKRLTVSSDVKKSIDAIPGMGRFVDSVFKKRDLVLYAQRSRISDWYRREHYDLADTNVPFDWDHISPHSLLYNRKKIPPVIKYWYNTNGNFRAWPYFLNRMDQDGTPSAKLDPLNPKHLEGLGERESAAVHEFWRRYLKKRDLTREELAHTLRDWSCCDEAWSKCAVDDLKSGWRAIYHLIVSRNLHLVQGWFDELHIESLCPKAGRADLPAVLNKRKWKTVDSHDILEPDSDYVYWVTSLADFDGGRVWIYLAYPDVLADEELSLLAVGEVEVGLFEEPGARGVIARKVNAGTEVDAHIISNNFTLISFEGSSYGHLLGEIRVWLKSLSRRNMDFATPFVESLVQAYQG